jgi:hypothetical protein
MEKTFSIPLPDELWVDAFTENKTIQYSYNGPDIVSVEIGVGDTIGVVITDLNDYTLTPESKIVEVSGTNETDIAYGLLERGLPHDEHVFEDVVNHDGSIYQRVTNPHFQDIYTLEYNTDTGFSKVLIVKDTDNSLKIANDKNILFVTTSLMGVQLEESDDVVYQNYITVANNFNDDVKSLFPWKYSEKITDLVVPSVPLPLIRIINEVENFNNTVGA